MSLHHGTVLVDTDLTALQLPGAQSASASKGERDRFKDRKGDRCSLQHRVSEARSTAALVNLVRRVLLTLGHLRRYLTPDKRKLQAKGSDLSRRAREEFLELGSGIP